MAIKTYTTKSGELRHQAQLWCKGKSVKSKSFGRKIDAREWLKREEVKALDIKIGRLKGESLTLDEFFHEIYWPQKEVRESTAVDYMTIYTNHIFPMLGQKKMGDICENEWSCFFKQLQKNGVSPSRINRIHTVASAIYALALKRGYVKQNPLTLVGYLEEGLHGLEFWTESEVQKFLNHALETKNPSFVLYLLAYETGMRLAELQGLSRDCINFDGGTIVIRRTYSKHVKRLLPTTKSGRERVIGMSEGLMQYLQKYLESHSHDLVFSDKNGDIATQDQIRWSFFEEQKKAGVRRIRFHSLRHTFASHFVMRGGNIYDLKELLGHSQIETTMRYAHLSKDHLKSKANIVTFKSEVQPQGTPGGSSISQVFGISGMNRKPSPSYLTVVKS